MSIFVWIVKACWQHQLHCHALSPNHYLCECFLVFLVGPTSSPAITLGDSLDNCGLKVVFARNLKGLAILTVCIG